MQYSRYYPDDVLLRFKTHPEEMEKATAPFDEKDVLYRLTQTEEEKKARRSSVDEYVIVPYPSVKGFLRLWVRNYSEEIWLHDNLDFFPSQFIQYLLLRINLEE